MDLALVGQAAALFAVTNIDDIIVLAVFFGQAAGHPGSSIRVVIGQYAGFVAILALALAGSVGAGLLPDAFLPYLGLIPLLLGLSALLKLWRERRDSVSDDINAEPRPSDNRAGPTVTAVALVTFANGGDNIGLYIPVFTTVGIGTSLTYCAVFFVLVAGWCALGRFLATRQVVARTVELWGHIVLPLVLIGLGAFILIDGLKG